jgi:hypothetical protein
MQNRSPLRSPFALFIVATYVGSSAIYSILSWQAIWFLISIFLYTLFYIAAFGWRPLVHWMWISGLPGGIGLIAGGYTVMHVVTFPKEAAWRTLLGILTFFLTSIFTSWSALYLQERFQRAIGHPKLFEGWDQTEDEYDDII